MKSASLLFGFLLAFSSAGMAQSNLWSIRLSNGDTLAGCALKAVNDSVLTIGYRDSVSTLSVDSVDLLSRGKGSHFWAGAGYGTLIGCGVGAVVGLATYEKPTGPFAIDLGPGVSALGGAILGGAGGFVIGGIVGASMGGTQEYELAGRSRESKVAVIRMIISD